MTDHKTPAGGQVPVTHRCNDGEPGRPPAGRFDSYSQAEHIAHLEAARARTEARKQARRERARAAAARLRDATAPLHEGEGPGRAAVEPKTQATRSHVSSSGPHSTRGDT